MDIVKITLLIKFWFWVFILCDKVLGLRYEMTQHTLIFLSFTKQKEWK